MIAFFLNGKLVVVLKGLFFLILVFFAVFGCIQQPNNAAVQNQSLSSEQPLNPSEAEIDSSLSDLADLQSVLDNTEIEDSGITAATFQ